MPDFKTDDASQTAKYRADYDRLNGLIGQQSTVIAGLQKQIATLAARPVNPSGTTTIISGGGTGTTPTVPIMVGATSTTPSIPGLVPSFAAGTQDLPIHADGTAKKILPFFAIDTTGVDAYVSMFADTLGGTGFGIPIIGFQLNTTFYDLVGDEGPIPLTSAFASGYSAGMLFAAFSQIGSELVAFSGEHFYPGAHSGMEYTSWFVGPNQLVIFFSIGRTGGSPVGWKPIVFSPHYRTVFTTSAVTLQPGDNCNTLTAGAVTHTLPLSENCQGSDIIYGLDSTSTGTVDVATTGGELFIGTSSIAVPGTAQRIIATQVVGGYGWQSTA